MDSYSKSTVHHLHVLKGQFRRLRAVARSEAQHVDQIQALLVAERKHKLVADCRLVLHVMQHAFAHGGKVAVVIDLHLQLCAGTVVHDNVDHAIRVLLQNRPGLVRLRLRIVRRRHDGRNVDLLTLRHPLG